MTFWDLMPGIAERFGFHPADARILELLDGLGSPDRLARAAAHLARCRRCSERAARMEEALNLMKPLVPASAPPHCLSEGESLLRQSMAAAEAGGDEVPGEILEALLGRGHRGQAAAVSQEMAASLLGSKALARAAAGAPSGEVRR